MDNTKLIKELRDSLPPQIDYAELVGSPIHSSYGKCYVWDDPMPYMIERAANTIESITLENTDLRNELCLRCGKYHEAHSGACDGCRWNNDKRRN